MGQLRRVPSTRPRPGRRLRRAAWILALMTGAWAALWFVWIPYPLMLDRRDPHRTALMKQREREARARGDTLVIRQEWVPLDRISRNLRRAVLVAEDDAFYQHRGIDWRAVAEEVRWQGGPGFSWRDPGDREALWAAIRYVRENQGALRGRSTITQQVAKNLYFGTERSLSRKVREFLVARRLERHLEKDRILEIYLNIAEWGPGIFGAEAASRHYFGRSAAELTRDQAAALAGTLPHPLTSNPHRNPGRMRWRQALILERMDPPTGVTLPPIPPPEPDPPELLLPPAPDAPLLPPQGVGPDSAPPPDTTPRRDTVPPPDTTPRRDTLPPPPPQAPPA